MKNKFFQMSVIKTELCRVCRKLKLGGQVCKSVECRATRKLAR